MSDITEQVVDELAQDVLKLAEATNDPELVNTISRALATSSATTQEAFLAAVRMRTAVARARALLAEKARAALEADKAKDA